MKNFISFFFCFLLIFLSSSAEAANTDLVMANEIGTQLYELLNHPESLKVIVNNGEVWVTAHGSDMDGVRADIIKIRAKLKKGVLVYNKEYPSDSIESSEGEIVLLEKDINNYFSKEANTKGFSNLKFDFTSNGFSANGNYTADFLLNFVVQLSAFGKLGLEKDGVYLKETVLSLQGINASDTISQLIVNKLNPLLSFSKIPFPIAFNKIIMDTVSATMTANPKPLSCGSVWSK